MAQVGQHLLSLATVREATLAGAGTQTAGL
jgi:hypothetical protein